MAKAQVNLIQLKNKETGEQSEKRVRAWYWGC